MAMLDSDTVDMNPPSHPEMDEPPLQPDVEMSEADQAPPRDPGTMAASDDVS